MHGPPGGDGAAIVEGHFAVGHPADDGVNDHVAGSGVEGKHVVQGGAGGDDGGVGDAADIVDGPVDGRVAEQDPVAVGHGGDAEAAGGDVALAQVGNGCHAGALGDESTGAEVEEGGDGLVAEPAMLVHLALDDLVTNLARGHDQIDFAHGEAGFLHNPVGGGGEEFADGVVSLGDAIERSSITGEDIENALSQGRLIFVIFGGDYFDLSGLAVPGDEGDDGSGTVGGGAGVQADDGSLRLFQVAEQTVQISRELTYFARHD